MKNIWYYLLLLALTAGFTACSDDDKKDKSQGLTVVELDNANFFYAEGGISVVVMSEEGFTADSDQPWCRTSISGKNLTITVDPNQNVEDRYAAVTITSKSGNSKTTVNVEQLSAVTSFETYEMRFDGKLKDPSAVNSLTITYTTDVDLLPPTIDAASPWITGAFINAERKELTITVAPNDSNFDREGYVLIKRRTDANDGNQIRVNVFQYAFGYPDFVDPSQNKWQFVAWRTREIATGELPYQNYEIVKSRIPVTFEATDSLSANGKELIKVVGMYAGIPVPKIEKIDSTFIDGEWKYILDTVAINGRWFYDIYLEYDKNTLAIHPDKNIKVTEGQSASGRDFDLRFYTYDSENGPRGRVKQYDTESARFVGSFASGTEEYRGADNLTKIMPIQYYDLVNDPNNDIKYDGIIFSSYISAIAIPGGAGLIPEGWTRSGQYYDLRFQRPEPRDMPVQEDPETEE